MTSVGRGARWVALTALVGCLGVVAVVSAPFRARAPLSDGVPLPENVTRVTDGYASSYIVDNPDGSVLLVDCGMTVGLQRSSTRSPGKGSRSRTFGVCF